MPSLWFEALHELPDIDLLSPDLEKLKQAIHKLDGFPPEFPSTLQLVVRYLRDLEDLCLDKAGKLALAEHWEGLLRSYIIRRSKLWVLSRYLKKISETNQIPSSNDFYPIYQEHNRALVALDILEAKTLVNAGSLCIGADELTVLVHADPTLLAGTLLQYQKEVLRSVLNACNACEKYLPPNPDVNIVILKKLYEDPKGTPKKMIHILLLNRFNGQERIPFGRFRLEWANVTLETKQANRLNKVYFDMKIRMKPHDNWELWENYETPSGHWCYAAVFGLPFVERFIEVVSENFDRMTLTNQAKLGLKQFHKRIRNWYFDTTCKCLPVKVKQRIQNNYTEVANKLMDRLVSV